MKERAIEGTVHVLSHEVIRARVLELHAHARDRLEVDVVGAGLEEREGLAEVHGGILTSKGGLSRIPIPDKGVGPSSRAPLMGGGFRGAVGMAAEAMPHHADRARP